jgi:uncharacterized membrane protein HdeD (DUF308 family)
MLAGYLLGAISFASFTASAFFFRFWRETRDFVFFAFAVYFGIEGVDRFVLVFLERPNEGSPILYVARLVGLVFILAAILKKNYGSRRRTE